MRSRTLIFTVLSLHLALFFFDFSKKSTPPPKRSLIVNTYVQPPPKRYAQKPTKRAQPKRKPRATTRRQKVLKELGEILTKLESKQEELPPSPLTLPKSITRLQIDGEEVNYFSLLTQRLKEALELPEVGSVKLELTLQSNGRVIKVHVLLAESEKNKHYLEQQLMFLGFPPFTSELITEREHTFVLTFFNEK
ncbi:MAG: hypothetical protein K1060chlam2_00019 [Chlamydiae bacterium]|nr:hypothetical protein [Chlamydiota bacterium]